jgi:imidazolonepropionase-like amidohydrolase
MGYDSGPPGANALELVRMVDGGLTRLEGIAAATRGSAQALGLEDVGLVEPGHEADLVAVAGDPLEDVAVFTRPESIRLVVRAGAVVASR